MPSVSRSRCYGMHSRISGENRRFKGMQTRFPAAATAGFKLTLATPPPQLNALIGETFTEMAVYLGCNYVHLSLIAVGPTVKNPKGADSWLQLYRSCFVFMYHD